MPPRWKSDYSRKPPRFAYVRSCLPLLVLVILFSFLLSSIALLSHFRSPAAKQQLGWQAWDVVEMHYAQAKNRSDKEGEVFAPSIPLEYWVSLLDWGREEEEEELMKRILWRHIRLA